VPTTSMAAAVFLITWVLRNENLVSPVESASPRPASTKASLLSEKKPIAPSRYAGDDACRPCHQEQTESFLPTAHHLTSRPADKDSISGKFSPDANVLRTSNPDLFFKMESDKDGYFQIVVEGRAPNTTSRRERFDLVIGSGRKGQTYLYWKGDQLFQLPISYWTELGQWVNSPGYRDGSADFSRRVPPRCLECHATYFHSVPPPPNRYQQNDFVLGISCEKCHGPGLDHVTRHNSKSAGAYRRAIVNPAKLSRDLQLDLCALCHAGPGEPAPAPAFSFLPGDNIDDYLNLQPLDPDAPVDVHGSQVELLKKSRCFQSSETMTCSTCHNVHLMQRDAAAFSDRCLSCHRVEDCGLDAKHGNEIVRNCIDCHMPNQETSLVVSTWNGRKVQPRVRNHWIKVYSANPVR
jgi:hypothetical protein